MAELKSKKTVQISRLVPYENNPKTHSEHQIGRIMDSIREFGFLSPVLIDDQNRIIVGHGRVEAASRLGMSAVPCVSVSGLTDMPRREATAVPVLKPHSRPMRELSVWTP